MPETNGRAGFGADPFVWIREHWALVAAIAFVLLFVWIASGEPHHENGRYVLVKDDVPCQTPDADGRRWCYVVLDTRTGKLDERVRKLGARNE